MEAGAGVPPDGWISLAEAEAGFQDKENTTVTEIAATLVKTLREQTGAGMMECKKALQEAKGDLKRAGSILREKGAAKAVKRAARATKEGRIAAKVSPDKRKGALVEVNIETDFAARNERFAALVEVTASTALECACDCLDTLLAARPAGSDANSVRELVEQALAVIGENMGVRRCATLKVPDGKAGLIRAYIHPPGRVGVLVELACESEAVAQSPATDGLAFELCLQIAFSNPAGIAPSSIPADVIAAEKEVYRNQAIKEGKPEKILDKIVEGRLKSFFRESCLLEQGYVKQEDKTIAQLIAETSKAAGGGIAIAHFVRYQLGEGVEEDSAE